MAPQLTETRGLLVRVESLWIAAATNSFPVPEGPVIRTVESVLATLLIRSKTSFMVAERPIMPWNISAAVGFSRVSLGIGIGERAGLRTGPASGTIAQY